MRTYSIKKQSTWPDHTLRWPSPQETNWTFLPVDYYAVADCSILIRYRRQDSSTSSRSYSVAYLSRSLSLALALCLSLSVSLSRSLSLSLSVCLSLCISSFCVTGKISAGVIEIEVSNVGDTIGRSTKFELVMSIVIYPASINLRTGRA